jgi:hypothetical protein
MSGSAQEFEKMFIKAEEVGFKTLKLFGVFVGLYDCKTTGEVIAALNNYKARKSLKPLDRGLSAAFVR